MNFTMIIIICVAIIVVALLPSLLNTNNLNRIKAKKTGDGQFGTADWATEKELKKNLDFIHYDPKSWRKGVNLPSKEGTVVGAVKNATKTFAYVDTSDNHTMIVAAPGGGKTTTLLYPNLEYSAAAGMSGFVTDTKGDVSENIVPVLKKHYNCSTYVVDLRYPLKSASYNILYPVNKYFDRYKKSGNLADIASAESSAKIIAKNIIHLDGFQSAGQNQFFYASAEGVIAGIILLISEFAKEGERHIVSVFKVIRQLMEVVSESVEDQNSVARLYLTDLYLMLPDDHTAKDLLAPTATSEFKTVASVMSTAMSVMLQFIDKEIEQILCFDNGFDVDDFIKGKYFFFFIVDEKSDSKNFLVNLIVRQVYGELLRKAEKEEGNKLPHRIIQWLDEFGTYSKIDGAEQMFSAGRSRNIITVPIIQNLAQLDKRYGKDGAKIIKNSCQNLLFGFQSPTSDDAVTFSNNLGTQTVMTGSVSVQNNYGLGHNSSSQNLNMTKRNLMTPDEIRLLKKGYWVFMKSGMNPAKMRLFKTEDWGIRLKERFTMSERDSQEVSYAHRDDILTAVRIKYSNRYYSNNNENQSKSKAETNNKFTFDDEDFK